MHGRVVRRSVAVGAAFVLVFAGSAFADTIQSTSDLLSQGKIQLGSVEAGSTITVDPKVAVTCTGSAHLDATHSAVLSGPMTSAPAGGFITPPATVTIGPATANWPADGQLCPTPAPVLAGPAMPITIGVPSIGGAYEYTILYSTSVSPSGTDDDSLFSMFFALTFDLTAVANTPPVLDLPAPMTVEGNTTNGAVVTYSATATDAEDATPPTPTCVPASGSFFGLGTTTVDCSATDSGGLTTSGSFDVTVVDTTPPSLDSLPGTITVSTSDPAGANVTYSQPTATDIVDPAPVVTCVPPSGTLFQVGMTQVTCTATDASGNSVTGTFSVEVEYVPVTPPHVFGATWWPPVSSAILPIRNGRTVPVKVAITEDGAPLAAGDVELSLTPLVACPDPSAPAGVAGLEALAAAGPAASAGTLQFQPNAGRWSTLLDASQVQGDPGSCSRADVTVDGSVAAAFVLQIVQ